MLCIPISNLTNFDCFYCSKILENSIKLLRENNSILFVKFVVNFITYKVLKFLSKLENFDSQHDLCVKYCKISFYVLKKIVDESVLEKPGFHLFFEKVYNLPREFEKATLKLLIETDL